MYHEFNFANRLSQLRIQHGTSARDMSLSLGQNSSYINKIETGKAMPSLEGFFYICEYLRIHPSDFFNTDTEYPARIRKLMQACQYLSGEQMDHILAIVNDLAKK